MKINRRRIAKALAITGSIWLIPALLSILLRLDYLPDTAFLIAVMSAGIALWVLWILVALRKIEGDAEVIVWPATLLFHAGFAWRYLDDGDFLGLLFAIWYLLVAYALNTSVLELWGRQPFVFKPEGEETMFHAKNKDTIYWTIIATEPMLDPAEVAQHLEMVLLSEIKEEKDWVDF